MEYSQLSGNHFVTQLKRWANGHSDLRTPAWNALMGFVTTDLTLGSESQTIQVPTSLSVLNVSVLPNGSGPPNGCPGSANYGIKIDIKYQVLDQNGHALQSAVMIPHEHGTQFDGSGFDNNIGNVTGYPTSSQNTAADGTFHDVPFGVCSNLPISSPGRTATQFITIMMPDGSAPGVRTQTWTVTAPGSQSFGHGSITNSVGDITANR